MEDKLKEYLILDEKCENEISKTFSQYKKLSILYLIWVVFTSIRYLFKLFDSIQKPMQLWSNIFNYKIYPVLYLMQLALGVLHVYYYLHAFKMQKQSQLSSDQLMFAESYKVFRKGNFVSFIVVIVSFICSVIYSFQMKIN